MAVTPVVPLGAAHQDAPRAPPDLPLAAHAPRPKSRPPAGVPRGADTEPRVSVVTGLGIN